MKGWADKQPCIGLAIIHGGKTQGIPLSSLASALHLETRSAHKLFLTRACSGRIWFLEGNTLPCGPSCCKAARRWRKRLWAPPPPADRAAIWTPIHAEARGEFWSQSNSKQVLTPASVALTQLLSEPLKPTQDEWRSILNPPSAPGSGPKYSRAASLSHFYLGADVCSFSSKTAAAVSAKRVIHTSQISVRVSFGLKSLFSGVTWQLTSNFWCGDTVQKYTPATRVKYCISKNESRTNVERAGSSGN